MTWKALWQKLKPFEGVIRFIIVLIATHYFWKFTIIGDESDRMVTFLGLNLSPFFMWVTHIVADLGYQVVHWFTDSVHLFGNTITFNNGSAVRVIWACNGLKQMFIFICIMLFSRGPMKHKLWFILCGLGFLFMLNLIRVAGLAMIIRYDRELFHLFHNYIFKYMFYGFIFLIWVFWEEYFLPRYQTEELETKQSLGNL